MFPLIRFVIGAICIGAICMGAIGAAIGIGAGAICRPVLIEQLRVITAVAKKVRINIKRLPDQMPPVSGVVEVCIGTLFVGEKSKTHSPGLLMTAKKTFRSPIF